jgi:hypothetical protein
MISGGRNAAGKLHKSPINDTRVSAVRLIICCAIHFNPQIKLNFCLNKHLIANKNVKLI